MLRSCLSWRSAATRTIRAGVVATGSLAATARISSYGAPNSGSSGRSMSTSVLGYDGLALGVDSSTQGVKVVAIDSALKIVHSTALRYDDDLPEYGTTNAVHEGPEPGEVTQPTAMIADAIDRAFMRMKEEGFQFERVRAVSGSGQQHGSVYWARGADEGLAAMDPGQSVAEQLPALLARSRSPIWMDSSTRPQCSALEEAAGGPEALARATGSRAYERFTGNYVARLVRGGGAPGSRSTSGAGSEGHADGDDGAALADRLSRVSLISSMGASLLAGHVAPIDYSDGSGMNLLDIRGTGDGSQGIEWLKEALEACGPEGGEGAGRLRAWLGEPVPSHAPVAGEVSAFCRDRYGFGADVTVAAWSGDNPNSVAGLRLSQPGEIAVSLGTSDTIFGIAGARDAAPGLEGHVFVSPSDPASRMLMLCYKNGSLTRERVRDMHAGGSWERFNAALERTSPGNNGTIGFFVDHPEITPPIQATGDRLFDREGRRVDMPVAPEGLPAESRKLAAPMPGAKGDMVSLESVGGSDAVVRAVVESQFLSMKAHGAALGLHSPKRVLVTGGASANEAVTQVLADVLGAPVYAADTADSAALGAAYRALHSRACVREGNFVPLEQALKECAAAAGQDGEPSVRLVAKPRPDAQLVYAQMEEAFRAREATVMEEKPARG